MKMRSAKNWNVLLKHWVTWTFMFKGSFIMILLLCFFTTLCLDATAKDLGVHGALFKISEPSLLKTIEQRLHKLQKSGRLADEQQKIAKRIQEQVITLHPVANVTHTTQPRHFLWDPTSIVEEDIKDHHGNLIIKKGTRINPLDHVSWGKPILFIDGEAGDQVECAKRFPDQKLILIKGKPQELEQQLRYPVYFDQGGIIVKKFGIKQVPCRVSQQRKYLLVEEFVPTTQERKQK